MKNNIPAECRQNLEDIQSKRELFENEIMYKQGFIDGIKIATALNMIWRKISKTFIATLKNLYM